MLLKDYNYYLFDVDRTIWAFDKNAKSAIFKLLDHYFVAERFGITDKEDFFNRYETINKHLWEKYEAGEIDKDFLRVARFLHTFKSYFKDDNRDSLNGSANGGGSFNGNNSTCGNGSGSFNGNGNGKNEYSACYKKIKKLSEKFTVSYVEQMVFENALEPGAKLVLKTLHERGKKIAVITNGFAEMQYRKLANSKLSEYIDAYIISEEVGYMKPDPKIFKAAIDAIGGTKDETLMIGDDFTNDIEGAQIFGIDQYYYNPFHKPCDGGPTYEKPTLLDLI